MVDPEKCRPHLCQLGNPAFSSTNHRSSFIPPALAAGASVCGL